MPTRKVPADFATISLAVAGSGSGDTILVGANYAGNEAVLVAVNNLTINAPATVSNISLTLDTGIAKITLAGDSDINVTGNGLKNTIYGNAGNNHFDGAGGADTLFGGGGKDTLVLGGGNDVGWGGNNNDRIEGGTGADQVHGEAGSDKLFGGTGDDTIDGGRGRDVLTGGDGADTFVFRSIKDTGKTAETADFITDVEYSFGDGPHDTIDLKRIDANTGHAGNDQFTYISDDPFSHVAGELRVAVEGDHYAITGDVDGDAVADFMILFDTNTGWFIKL